MDDARLPQNPDIDVYFRNLDRMLAGCIDNGAKAVTLNQQIEAWEIRERQLNAWVASASDTPNPFTPPLDALAVGVIIARLGRRLCELRDEIKAGIAAAEASIRDNVDLLRLARAL